MSFVHSQRRGYHSPGKDTDTDTNRIRQSVARTAGYRKLGDKREGIDLPESQTGNTWAARSWQHSTKYLTYYAHNGQSFRQHNTECRLVEPEIVTRQTEQIPLNRFDFTSNDSSSDKRWSQGRPYHSALIAPVILSAITVRQR